MYFMEKIIRGYKIKYIIIYNIFVYIYTNMRLFKNYILNY